MAERVTIPALVPLPDSPFYLWQMLVQAVELRRKNIPVTYLVYTGALSDQLRCFMDAKIAPIHVWDDWRPRTQRSYGPAMKPWLVGRYLEAHPELVTQPFVLMDPDVIPIRSSLPIPTPTTWHGTDTDSYTGPGYIRSKGEGLWLDLCRIADVDPDKAAQAPGIGAQYTFTGQDHTFWYDVARKSVLGYRHMVQNAARYTPKDTTPIQAWCSEMYFMQFEMIRRGITPSASPQMSMVWADGPATGWKTAGFFHAAGVTGPSDQHFYKAGYQNSPFGRAITVSPESASARYVRLIAATEKTHPELVW